MASTYPGTLDNLTTNKADGTAMATDHKNHHNDLADAVNKIERNVIPVFNVKGYGAVGDGTTDDTTAITNAVNAATAGGVVYFPTGAYKITSEITVPRISHKGLCLKGAGAAAPDYYGATTIVYSGSNYCFNFGGGSVADFASYQGIEDMKIDMSASATPTGAISIKSAFYCEFRRVSILGPTGGSKILVNFDPGDGSFGNYHNRFYNCSFQGTTSASDIGIKLLSTNANGANSNQIRDNWFGVFLNSILVDGADSTRITGNEFNGTTNTGIKLQSTNTNDTKILENKFDGPTTAVNVGASVARTVILWNSGASAMTDAGIGTVVRDTVNMPTCAVRKAADQVITTATTTPITFDTEMLDLYNMHDNVTNPTRITIKNDGVYTISGNLAWASSSAGTQRIAALRVNGSTDIAKDIRVPGGAINQAVSVSNTAYTLNRGDYVELTVFHDTGSNLNVFAISPYSPSLTLARVDA